MLNRFCAEKRTRALDRGPFPGRGPNSPVTPPAQLLKQTLTVIIWRSAASNRSQHLVIVLLTSYRVSNRRITPNLSTTLSTVHSTHALYTSLFQVHQTCPGIETPEAWSGDAFETRRERPKTPASAPLDQRPSVGCQPVPVNETCPVLLRRSVFWIVQRCAKSLQHHGSKSILRHTTSFFVSTSIKGCAKLQLAQSTAPFPLREMLLGFYMQCETSVGTALLVSAVCLWLLLSVMTGRSNAWPTSGAAGAWASLAWHCGTAHGELHSHRTSW